MRPMMRAHGRLTPLDGLEDFRPEDAARNSPSFTRPRASPRRRAQHEVDFSFRAGLSRFRVNAFRQRGSISIVCRAIPFEIKSMEELLLPPVISELAEEERGIILLIVNRTIDFFPLHMHGEARAMLAGTLKGVVSQRLVPTPDGQGRVAVCEVLRMTGRVRDMIVNPEETGRLQTAIAEGVPYGMRTFDQALLEHVQAGRVAWRTRCEPPHTRTTSSCWSPPTASARPPSSR